MKKAAGIILCLAALLMAAGCGTAEKEATPLPAGMREVKDDLGRTVRIPVRIERAVSLAPNLTENIFAVGAGDRLVGVTTFCDFPAAAKKIKKVGDTMNPNMESIVALRPDVVFISTASQIEAFMKTLADNNVAVYVTDPQSFEDILQNLEQLGDLFGTQDRAKDLTAELRTRVGAVTEGVKDAPRVPVFVQISKEPLFTIGSESFLTEAIELAGGASVTKNVPTAYPKLSKETALALRPEVIILSDSEDNREPNELFRGSPAVAAGRVERIDPDVISRPGPRLVDAIEQIANALHADRF